MSAGAPLVDLARVGGDDVKRKQEARLLRCPTCGRSSVATKIGTSAMAKSLWAKRERLSLPLRFAAKEAGVSPSTFSRAERDVGKVDIESACKLARWLGLGLDALYMEKIR